MRPPTLEAYKERMLRVLVHIQQHLDGTLGLDELADVAGFSPYHFHRIFRGLVGESVHDHVRRLRLERAASRLKISRQSVTAIAFEAGYETPEAFSRAFRALLGVSPSAFRSRNGVRPRAAAPSGVHYREGRRPHDFAPARMRGEPMDVRIEVLSPLRVAFVRHVGPYDQCSVAWETLGMHLGRQGLIGPDARFIGLCHDDPEVTPPERVRYDACITVDESFQPEGEIGVQVIPGGDYAVTTHVGPYSTVGQTYVKLLGEWLPRSGRELGPSPCLEMYLNDPEGTDPQDLVTDIYAPLAERM